MMIEKCDTEAIKEALTTLGAIQNIVKDAEIRTIDGKRVMILPSYNKAAIIEWCKDTRRLLNAAHS